LSLTSDRQYPVPPIELENADLRITHRHSNRAHAGSYSYQGPASRFSIWRDRSKSSPALRRCTHARIPDRLQSIPSRS
jgi:hypothetical protein